MNIVIGKLGKSILFNSKNWGAIGGDLDAPIFYENLITKNPQHTFYILGKSDYVRLSPDLLKRINKHNNIIDMWDSFKEFKDSYKEDMLGCEVAYIDKWVAESKIKIDAGIFFSGLFSSANVYPKCKLVKDKTKAARPLFMQCKYTGPIYTFLNETKIPYSIIVTDPRYYPLKSRDLFNYPKKVLSQYNEDIKYKAYTSYDLTTENITTTVTYDRIETIFLIGKERKEYNDKNINFMIVCNEGKPSRYDDLKEYVLDYIDDVDVYGQWNKEIIENDKRFKGPKKFIELEKMLPNVKYTFCIPIKKGWVTAKFWEMAHYGVIPFLHPDYDDQNNLNIPDFFRIKNPDDLYNKIKYLDNNIDMYNKIRKLLNKYLKDEYYNGEYCNNIAINAINESIKLNEPS